MKSKIHRTGQLDSFWPKVKTAWYMCKLALITCDYYSIIAFCKSWKHNDRTRSSSVGENALLIADVCWNSQMGFLSYDPIITCEVQIGDTDIWSTCCCCSFRGFFQSLWVHWIHCTDKLVVLRKQMAGRRRQLDAPLPLFKHHCFFANDFDSPPKESKINYL